jgi:hypothetical protein
MVNLLHARDLCLGKKEERSRDRATRMPDGTYVGGTAFERNKRANPVKANTRCFSVGNSFEAPTKIMAPCADNKITGNDDADAVKMRQTLLKVRRLLLVYKQLLTLLLGINASGDEIDSRGPARNLE